MHPERNIACIDGQNLHHGAKQGDWSVDYRKLRIYLKDKYRVDRAYYFLGFVSAENELLYGRLRNAGYVLIFREHAQALLGTKKGNVDCDIIFEIMKMLIEDVSFEKVILVSGDGDYKKLVDYLIAKERFEKILFPNRNFASSLYKRIERIFFDFLDSKDIKAKIAYVGK